MNGYNTDFVDPAVAAVGGIIDFTGKTIHITGNIDLSAHEWIGIGQVPFGENGFNGTMDGTGSKITGMHLDSTIDAELLDDFASIDDTYSNRVLEAYGLIARVGWKGIIKNLTVEGNLNINTRKGYSYARVGGIAGINLGTI